MAQSPQTVDEASSEEDIPPSPGLLRIPILSAVPGRRGYDNGTSTDHDSDDSDSTIGDDANYRRLVCRKR